MQIMNLGVEEAVALDAVVDMGVVVDMGEVVDTTGIITMKMLLAMLEVLAAKERKGKVGNLPKGVLLGDHVALTVEAAEVVSTMTREEMESALVGHMNVEVGLGVGKYSLFSC